MSPLFEAGRNGPRQAEPGRLRGLENDGMTERDVVGPKTGIVVVAYNAASTLAATLDRIPQEVLGTVAEIIISDDASHDDTFDHAPRWSANARSVRTTVVRHTKNLGYGGNQKAAYRLAIEHGLDIVVLLHGD